MKKPMYLFVLVVSLLFSACNDTELSMPVYETLGEQIAFVSNREGERAIYLMDIDGADQFRVSKLDGESFTWSCCPAWSSDGMQLAYALNYGTMGGPYLVSVGLYDLRTGTTMIMGECNSKLHQCLHGRAPSRLWWSQKDECIALLSYTHTGAYRSDVSIAESVGQQDFQFCSWEKVPTDAISYTYENCSGNNVYCLKSLFNREEKVTEAFLISTSGMTITLGIGSFRAGAWSPDFTKAAFVMLDAHSQDVSPLYVIHIPDTEPRPLATELEIAERSGLTWSPDSCWVAFSAKRRDCSSCDNTDIYRLNVETGEVRQLTTDPAEDIHPVWQPTP